MKTAAEAAVLFSVVADARLCGLAAITGHCQHGRSAAAACRHFPSAATRRASLWYQNSRNICSARLTTAT